MRAKTSLKASSLPRAKFGFPTIFVLCVFFFLTGLWGSALIAQDQDSSQGRTRGRILESPNNESEYVLPSAGETGDESLASIPFQILSWKTRAIYFPNFATEEMCDRVISMAKPGLEPSELALREGETKESTEATRTSSGMFISATEDKTGTLDIIEENIARATMIPRSHGEPFNILRYEIGQRYDSHYDAFNSAEYGPQKSNRVASLLLYLSSVEEGGETMFPYENGLNMNGNYDFESCIGLKVKPRKGDALLFYSLFQNGTLDLTSVHGSCPVVKGEKWVATKWIRDQELFD